MSIDKITKNGWKIGGKDFFGREVKGENSDVVTFVTAEENKKYALNGSRMEDGTYLVYFKEDELKTWMRTRLMDEML